MKYKELMKLASIYHLRFSAFSLLIGSESSNSGTEGASS